MKFKIKIDEVTGQSDADLFDRLLKTVDILYSTKREFVTTGNADIIIKNKRGKLFDKKLRTKPTGTPHECYQNSLKNHIDNPGLKVAAGICFSIDMLKNGLDVLDADLIERPEDTPGFQVFCFDHCWNVDKNNRLIDITLNSSKYIYFGELIDVDRYKIDDPSNYAQYSRIQDYIISKYYKR